MRPSHYATNLRKLCQQHKSVAQICRTITINRQQFNKYLSAKVYPSKHNLAKITSFFAITEEELNLPPKAFNDLLEQKQLANHPPLDSLRLRDLLDTFPSNAGRLRRYTGYYYNHLYAFGFPGSIIRSLVYIYEHNGRFYSKTVEHLWHKDEAKSRRYRFKYEGVVLYLADRIFVLEFESLTKHSICQTTLYPSYRNTLDSLSGVMTGVGSLNTHRPRAARVEYEFLGKEIHLRNTLRRCGLFKPSDPSISEDIKKRISNEIPKDDYMLTAFDG